MRIGIPQYLCSPLSTMENPQSMTPSIQSLNYLTLSNLLLYPPPPPPPLPPPSCRLRRWPSNRGLQLLVVVAASTLFHHPLTLHDINTHANSPLAPYDKRTFHLQCQRRRAHVASFQKRRPPAGFRRV